jgi:hypothetical protein
LKAMGTTIWGVFEREFIVLDMKDPTPREK